MAGALAMLRTHNAKIDIGHNSVSTVLILALVTLSFPTHSTAQPVSGTPDHSPASDLRAWPPEALSKQVIDQGLPGYRQWVDVNGDGNLDYCRFVGDPPKQFLSCQMGTAPGYLSKNPYGFNSPQGMTMGTGPYGMLAGTKDYGPRYCRYVDVHSRSIHGRGATTTSSQLRCIFGTPPIKGQTAKFLAGDASACAIGDDTAIILAEPDVRRDPYLFCKNSKSSTWSVQRTDPSGITWQLSSFSSYDKIGNSTHTDTLLRQLTRRLGASTLPTAKNKDGTYPVRFESHLTVFSDGSSQADFASVGGLDPSGNVVGLYNDVSISMKPSSGGLLVSAVREECYPLNDPTHGGQCLKTAGYSGSTADGATVTWQGPAPKPSDLQPSMGNLPQLFSEVRKFQSIVFSNTVAKAAPDLVNKNPAKWTSDDIHRIANVLAVAASEGGTPTQQSQSNAFWSLLTVRGLLATLGGYIGYVGAEGGLGAPAVESLAAMSDEALAALAVEAGLTPLGWALGAAVIAFAAGEYFSYKVDHAGEDETVDQTQQIFENCVKAGGKVSDCEDLKQKMLNYQ